VIYSKNIYFTSTPNRGEPSDDSFIMEL